MASVEELIAEVDGLISYWDGKLTYMRAYLDPAGEALIKLTIKHLKEVLERLKEEVRSGGDTLGKPR